MFIRQIRYSLPLIAVAASAAVAPRRGSSATRQATAPGLWDAHTHLTWSGAAALDSLVAHGVVAVRDCGGDALQLRAWRDSIAAGQRRGPMIYFAGPQLDGPKPDMRNRALVDSPQRAKVVVDSLAPIGVSFIKTHSAIPADAFFAVLREARRHRLAVAAHLPRGVPAWVAADSGVRSIEHAAESILASPLYANYAADVDGAMAWWRSAAGDSMLKHLARTRVAVTPTLVRYRSLVLRSANESERQSRQRVLDFLIELTGRMHRAGIVLLAGSDFDALDPGLMPGASLHTELELLEKAGLSHEDAIASASTEVSAWLLKADGGRR